MSTFRTVANFRNLALLLSLAATASLAEDMKGSDDGGSSSKGPAEVYLEFGAGYLFQGTVAHSVVSKKEQQPPLHASINLENLAKSGAAGIDLQISGLFNPAAEQGILDGLVGINFPLGDKGPRLVIGLGAQRSLSEEPIGLYTRWGYYVAVMAPMGSSTSFDARLGGFINTDVSFPAPEGPSYRLVFTRDFLGSAAITQRVGKLKLSLGGELFYLGAAAVASDSFYSEIESEYVPRIFADLRLPLGGAFYMRGRVTYEVNRDKDASFDRVLRAYTWNPNLMGELQAQVSAGWVY